MGDVSWELLGGPKRLPRSAEDGPRTARDRQEAPRTPQEASKKLPRDIPRGSERYPRGLWPFCSSSPLPRPPPPLPSSPLPRLLLRILLHPPLLGYDGIPLPLFLCVLPLL